MPLYSPDSKNVFKSSMSVEIKQNIRLGWLEITESKKSREIFIEDLQIAVKTFWCFYLLLGLTKLHSISMAFWTLCHFESTYSSKRLRARCMLNKQCGIDCKLHSTKQTSVCLSKWSILQSLFYTKKTWALFSVYQHI